MTLRTKVKLAGSILAAVLAGYIWYLYTMSQEFVQDSKTTATQGIFLQKTLNLSQYKLIASGNSLLGSYDRYSRSDRMGKEDALTIYCKEYCKK